VRQLIIEEKLSPYDEQTYIGLLRYLQIVVERRTGRVQLTLVLNQKEMEGPQPWLEKLGDRGEGLWHSLWINGNQLRTNAIFGESWRCYRGEPLLEESFDGTTVYFHPASFAQANLDLFERMIRQIKRSIASSRQLVEYYAGVGVIGLCLVDRFQQVRCCEVSPFAKRCFEQAKLCLTRGQAAKIEFVEGLTEQNLSLLDQSQLVIVDPPRKGIDPVTLKALNSSQATELVYVSCGWDSFKRDCQQLLSGGWSLVEAHAFLFFPGSNHLETLALFRK
jgi:23S rRNA (uracil1939-C5)-methyltransferase